MLNFVYCRLKIGFVILNKKVIVLILAVTTTEFEEKEILMKNSINLQNFKQI